MMELKDNLEGFQDTLVPPILKEDKSVKEFFYLRNDSITKLNEMVKQIAQDINI